MKQLPAPYIALLLYQSKVFYSFVLMFGTLRVDRDLFLGHASYRYHWARFNPNRILTTLSLTIL
jgi:hypothetical protein